LAREAPHPPTPKDSSVSEVEEIKEGRSII